MRSLVCAVAICCSFLFASAARADSTYDFTLTSTSGNAGVGSGSFEINTPPSTTTNSQSYYYAGSTSENILEALSFTIGGDTFNLANTYGSTFIRFTSGALDDITYAGAQTDGMITLSLMANGLEYTFTGANGETGTGTITDITLAPAAVTPEPSSIVLLGTGLLGAAGVMKRRLV